MSAEAVLEVEGLRASYGGTPILQGVDLRLGRTTGAIEDGRDSNTRSLEQDTLRRSPTNRHIHEAIRRHEPIGGQLEGKIDRLALPLLVLSEHRH